MQLLRLLALSATCSSVGCCFSTSYLVEFATSGRATLVAQLCGTLCTGLAKALLMILIILIAKGAAFSVGKLKRIREYPVILASLLIAIGLHLASEIHELYFHDPWSSYDLYETIPGKVTLSINLVLQAVVFCLVWQAYRGDAFAEARAFYRGVLVATFVEFVSQLVTLILAQFLAAYWIRKAIERIDLGTHFVVTVLLLRLLQPTRFHAIVVERSKLLRDDATDYDDEEGFQSHPQNKEHDMRQMIEMVEGEYCPPPTGVVE